ncbi:MAG: hypothetical protein BYD32DRAFT_16142 [Podila humilis]|nr:MAG: hypothetical protein BYD32DRAFT_16142 [Podila humilis]
MSTNPDLEALRAAVLKSKKAMATKQATPAEETKSTPMSESSISQPESTPPAPAQNIPPSQPKETSKAGDKDKEDGEISDEDTPTGLHQKDRTPIALLPKAPAWGLVRPKSPFIIKPTERKPLTNMNVEPPTKVSSQPTTPAEQKDSEYDSLLAQYHTEQANRTRRKSVVDSPAMGVLDDDFEIPGLGKNKGILQFPPLPEHAWDTHHGRSLHDGNLRPTSPHHYAQDNRLNQSIQRATKKNQKQKKKQLQYMQHQQQQPPQHQRPDIPRSDSLRQDERQPAVLGNSLGNLQTMLHAQDCRNLQNCEPTRRPWRSTCGSHSSGRR